MQRKLSDAQIAEIKRRLLARSVFWQSQRSIAKEFGVSHCLICACAAVNWISVSMVSVTEPCGDWACPSHPFAEVHRGVWEPAVFTQEQSPA
jgi:hypothetical protein